MAEVEKKGKERIQNGVSGMRCGGASTRWGVISVAGGVW